MGSELAELGDAAAASRGLSLLDLVITDTQVGLGGRTILQLTMRTEGANLPFSRLRAGSPAKLRLYRQEGVDFSLDGLIAKKSRTRLDFVTAGFTEPPDGPFRLDLARDEVSRGRERAALERVRSCKPGRLRTLREVTRGRLEPQFGATDETANALNAEQEQAIARGLAAEDFALIHGPPGTGKTRTLIELIRRSVARGERVLACAPSNTAVDNLVRGLAPHGLNLVRLGHPARVDEPLLRHTLDAQVEAHESVRLARNLVRESWKLMHKAQRFTRKKPEPGEKRGYREESRNMRREARALERVAVEAVLDRADVLCSTPSLDGDLLGDREFDLVVLDEAGQCTEPSSWIPLARGRRAILAGDHQQLPPTILSAEAARGGLATTLFESLMHRYGDRIATALSRQYRMHRAIMAFPSEAFYDGGLSAAPTNAEHLLADLALVSESELTSSPLRFIDTAGAGHSEEVEADGQSRANQGEAQVVLQHVTALRAAGVAADAIGIITPYAGQVRLLRGLLPEIEVNTVDGFQGREKEAIVVSLVRSNPDGEIGFLSDLRRTNVAMTRARRKLILIGDSATLAGHPFYSRLFTHLEAVDAYGTVWDDWA